ncbi:MAG: hypothetical protein H6741_23480 [Alphaproteobacteria bacterium]|nr:hypothetical protein [Alphaproteobacteria bacterium]
MLFALWLWSRLIHASAQALGGAGALESTQRRLGRAYGACGLLLFVLPEWTGFEWGGMEGLRAVIRLTAPLCLVSLLAWSTRVTRDTYQLTRARAAAAAIGSFFLHALPVSLFLR